MIGTQQYLRAGQMVKAYEIEELIGEGGYGQVYKARGPDDEPVAIKVVPSKSANDKRAAQRMLMEITIVMKIKDVNVVSYRDWGQHGDDYLWLATEYLVGRSLHQILAIQGSMSIERACRLMLQAASGLVAVHDEGVVHRDIKPGNLFLCLGDILKILDFGVSRNEDLHLLTSFPLGSPPYMAPGQLQAERGQKADPRWDLYALMVVFYHLVTGRNPFMGHGEEPSLYTIIERQLNMIPVPVTDLVPLCPERVANCVHKGLAKNVGDGWQSAVELKEELAGCLALFNQSDDDPLRHLERYAPVESRSLEPTRPLGPAPLSHLTSTIPIEERDLTSLPIDKLAFDVTKPVLQPEEADPLAPQEAAGRPSAEPEQEPEPREEPRYTNGDPHEKPAVWMAAELPQVRTPTTSAADVHTARVDLDAVMAAMRQREGERASAALMVGVAGELATQGNDFVARPERRQARANRGIDRGRTAGTEARSRRRSPEDRGDAATVSWLDQPLPFTPFMSRFALLVALVVGALLSLFYLYVLPHL
jgi:serine/threonine protein kinase